jgi:Uma2 family endonuclease
MNPLAKVDEPDGWMSRADYRQWAEGRPGRFERINGQVVAMAPERVGHTRIKGQAFMALTAAIAAAGLPFEVFVSGSTIEVGESDYEPDVIVRRGSEVVSDDSLAVPDATIIVEVLSPTTRRTDVSQSWWTIFGCHRCSTI